MSVPGNSINEAVTGVCGFSGTAFTSSPMVQNAVVLGDTQSYQLKNVSGLGTASQVLTSNGPGVPPTWQAGVVPTDLHTARFIVSPGGTADGANYTTIQSAITAAAAAGGKQTVFIQPKSTPYVENLTLSANVCLAAYGCDPLTGNVTISGKITATYTGECTISGIRLQTNSDFCLDHSGTNATYLYLVGCFINVVSGTGMSLTNTAGGIVIYRCSGQTAIGTKFFAKSGGSFFLLLYSDLKNAATGATASTISGSSITMSYTDFTSQIDVSGSSTMTVSYSSIYNITTSGTPTISFSDSFLGFVTLVGTGTFSATECILGGIPGTTTALTVGAGMTANLTDCIVGCSSGNAISGAGTLNYQGLTFPGTSSTITVTTQNNLKCGPSEVFGSANSGGTNTLTITNTSNTASSSANMLANVAGSTAADATFQSTITSGQAWTWGLDNSDSDAWVLASSATLGTTNVMRSSIAGAINKPLQPCFLVRMNTPTAAITGDATLANVLFTTTDYDQASNITLNSGGFTIFTAPVTGKYYFHVNLLLQGGAAGSTSTQVRFTTTSKTIIGGSVGSYANLSVNGTSTANLTLSVTIDMTAGETCRVGLLVNGTPKNISIYGDANTTSYFTGHLVA